MSQNAINYLKENKNKYSNEVLVEQLRKAGYAEDDINESLSQVLSGDGHKEKPEAIRYGGFWKRFFAFLIDAAIVFFAAKILTTTLFGRQIFYLTNLLLTWAYFIYMTHAYKATLGKMIFGMNVISEDAGELKIEKIILRETLGKFVSGMILGIGYLMIAFTPKKQGLHDKIAGTAVVCR